MWKRHLVILLFGISPACMVQTESVEGELGPPGADGVSPFSYAPNMKDIYYADGNVGIGTDSFLNSAVRLRVNAGADQAASAAFGGQIVVSGRGDGTDIPSYDYDLYGDALVLQSYYSNQSNRRFGDIVSLGLWARGENGANGGGEIRLLTNPQNDPVAIERVRIDRDGRVGIGTAVPQDLLTLKGGNLRLLRSDSFAKEGLAILDGGFSRPDCDSTIDGAIAYERTGAPNNGLFFLCRQQDSVTWGWEQVAFASDSSDARLKMNVASLGPSLSRILRLRGVTYDWREPAKHGNLSGTQIGMIAQEVEQVFPEWVGVDAAGYKTVTYRGFEALTVESFRDLKAENERLMADNTELAKRVAAQEAAMNRVKSEYGAELMLLKARLSEIEKRMAPLTRRAQMTQ